MTVNHFSLEWKNEAVEPFAEQKRAALTAGML